MANITHCLVGLFALCPGVTPAQDQPRETPAQCAKRLNSPNSPTDCFITAAHYKFQLCKLNVELAIASGDRSHFSCVSIPPDADVRPFYLAATKHLGKNAAGVNAAKDLYAFWRTAIAGLLPASDEGKGAYAARVAGLEKDLRLRAERLALEQPKR